MTVRFPRRPEYHVSGVVKRVKPGTLGADIEIRDLRTNATVRASGTASTVHAALSRAVEQGIRRLRAAQREHSDG